MRGLVGEIYSSLADIKTDNGADSNSNVLAHYFFMQ
jgi:hypothetical protein